MLIFRLLARWWDDLCRILGGDLWLKDWFQRKCFFLAFCTFFDFRRLLDDFAFAFEDGAVFPEFGNNQFGSR
jgi:hypothetical protein